MMKKKTTKRTNYTTKKTTRTRNIPKAEQPFLEGIYCDIYVEKKLELVYEMPSKKQRNQSQ